MKKGITTISGEAAEKPQKRKGKNGGEEVGVAKRVNEKASPKKVAARRKKKGTGKRGPDKKPRKGSPRLGREIPPEEAEEGRTGIKALPRPIEQRAITMLLDGHSVRKIGEELDVDVSAIYRWMALPHNAAQLREHAAAQASAAKLEMERRAAHCAARLSGIALGEIKAKPIELSALQDVLDRIGMAAPKKVEHTVEGNLTTRSDAELEAIVSRAAAAIQP